MSPKIETVTNGTLTTPRGFLAGAVSTGIAHEGKLDVAIVCSEEPCIAAATFTKNQVKAAPILVCQRHLANKRAQAIVVNSGNANAGNGDSGPADAAEMTMLTSKKLKIANEDVLVASTGIIGFSLPMEKIRDGIARIKVSDRGGNDFAKAIMTTDTKSKEIAINVHDGNMHYFVGGVTKGAGMIHPNMATMLCFITTDAAVEGEFLAKALRASVDRSFNMISVDGDTSTNDTVIVLANGKAGNKVIDKRNSRTFQDALDIVCIDLAKKIAADGEGTTKLIEAVVEGAYNRREAKMAAKAVVCSTLVKTMVYGSDPNWGRVIAALGNSKIQLEIEKLDLYLYNTCVFKQGYPVKFDREGLRKLMLDTKDVMKIRLCLNSGKGNATAWGCDLSEEYVTINSAYTS
jgi:glutamate N-acetyltransferase/amino-acid N-acetyltransferase